MRQPPSIAASTRSGARKASEIRYDWERAKAHACEIKCRTHGRVWGGAAPMDSLLLVSRTEGFSVPQFVLTRRHGATFSQCRAHADHVVRPKQIHRRCARFFHHSDALSRHLAVVIDIFFAVDRCQMRWVFIEIRSAYSKLLSIRVDPFPQFLA